MATETPVIRNLELTPELEDTREGAVIDAGDMEVVVDDPDVDPVDLLMAAETEEEDLRGALLHTDNLAEYIADLEGGEQILLAFGQDICDGVETDKESRSEWEDVFVKGLRLMGIKGASDADAEEYTELFEGASDVVMPLITEACIQFQSEALKAMIPPHGPADTVVIGEETPEKLQQSRRVKGFMNYMTMNRIVDYFEEHDRLLAYLGKSGSAFKKCTWNDVSKTVDVTFLPAEQVIISHMATSINKCGRIAHRETITADTLQHRIASGLYRNVPLQADAPQVNEVSATLKAQQGVVDPCLPDQDTYTIDEVHLNAVVPMFETDRGGLSAPYIVHVDSDSGVVLGIYRNWAEGDVIYERKNYFVHYPLIQSDGFYGYGFIHLLGQLTRSSTAALRQLLDAGTLSNMQAGFKKAGTRMAHDGEPLGAGEFRDVEFMGERISDAIMPLQFNEPSATLYQLMGALIEQGRRMVSLTDLNVGDGNPEAPVGTTIALLERGMNVMSAVHMRLCRAMTHELKIIARLSHDHLPSEYPYDVPGETRSVFKEDFNDRVDVVPVCDPRQFSQAQRIARAQNKLQLATQAPAAAGMNVREAYRDMLAEIDDSSLDRIMPPEDQAEPTDPMTENGHAITGKGLKAFIEQNHDAHIEAHTAHLENPQFAENPGLRQALEAHIQEHMAMRYQVEMMEAMGVESSEQLEQIPPEQLAVMVAQATQQVTGRAQAIAEAEARAEEPTIEQQALMQDLANKRDETERKALKDQMDFAKSERKRQTDIMVEQARLQQRDRQAEMSTAAQFVRFEQEEKRDAVDRFVRLVELLRDSNQAEQVRDSRTDLM